MKLKTPVSCNEVKRLKAGDVVYISGEIVTARDRAHEKAIKMPLSKLPVSFNVIYHCGPLVKKNRNWRVISCGPTTSARFEKYVGDIVKKYKTRIIVGKGGMSKKILKVLKKNCCAYLTFTGGCGVLAASSVTAVKEVHWLDLGIPEALWVLDVKDFGPLTVGMDVHGNSLF